MRRHAAATLAALALAGAAAVATGTDSPGKPAEPGPIMCVDDLCQPSMPDPRIDPIPPDEPPAAKLRRQLVKERRAHTAELRAMRAALETCRAR